MNELNLKPPHVRRALSKPWLPLKNDAIWRTDGDVAGVSASHAGEGVARRAAFHDRLRAEQEHDNLEAEGTGYCPAARGDGDAGRPPGGPLSACRLPCVGRC